VGIYPNLYGVRWGLSGDRCCTGNVQSIKDALEYGPVAVVFKKHNDFATFFSNYPTGVYRWDGQDSTYIDHAVAIVSYNNDDRYWICKNSFGESWADSGYFRIGFEECNIETRDAYRVLVDQSCIAKIVPNLKSSLNDAINSNSLANNEWIYEYGNETLTQEISNNSYFLVASGL
jgi:C1A family cysteine protease